MNETYSLKYMEGMSIDSRVSALLVSKIGITLNNIK